MRGRRRRGARWLAGTVAALALLAVMVVVTPAGRAAEDTPMLLGLAVGGDFRAEIDSFTTQQGKAPAFLQIFWHPGLFPEPQPWAAGVLADLHARGVTAWIEWTTSDLDSMASGGHDGRIRTMYASIDDFLLGGPDRSVVIAPLPEANLDSHPWCCDPVAYQKAFRRMRELAHEAGLGPAHVRFAFSMNGLSTRGRAYDQFYPGDAHVDLLAFARLNRGTHHAEGWRDYEDVFATRIRDLRAQIGTDKPIMVAQTGSVTAGGDRAAWLREMFTRLPAEDGVIGAIYFNRNKSADFRVHSHADGIPLDPTFEAGYATWSEPSATRWLFDGSLDRWVADRGGTPAAWPPSTDDPPPATNPFARSLAVTTRVGTGTPVSNAVALSQVRFPGGAARHVVLSRDDAFPDALAGTPLLADGPLLLTPTAGLPPAVRAELDRVLPSGGRVYLLGGPAALSPDIEAALTAGGYDVVRLAGPDRVATARRVAEEVARLYPAAARTVLVARAFGTPGNPTAAWADSVTGGGFAAWARHPVVLSATERLSPEAATFLAGRDRAVLLGGPAALSEQVHTGAARLAARVDRVAGAARDDTAVRILTDLWRRPTGEFRLVIVNGYSVNGWAFSLPAAGLSADFAAPLLPVAGNALPSATAAAVTSCFSKRVATVVVGAPSVVSDGVLEAVEARDHSC